MAISRKVYRQGNSCVISFPRWILEQIGAELGSKVEIIPYPGRMLTITVEREGVGPEKKTVDSTEPQA